MPLLVLRHVQIVAEVGRREPRRCSRRSVY